MVGTSINFINCHVFPILNMIKSVSDNQIEILQSIQQLYCPDGFECDLTYGNGGFWKDIDEPQYCFDIDPLKSHVVKAKSDEIPLSDNSLNNIVFDPPFLTYIKKSREHANGKMIMAKRFGGYYKYSELMNHYEFTLYECSRLLKKNGILVFKCQDIIHNHRMHCTHHNVINWAEKWNFRLEDLFVLAKKNRMPGPQRGKQRHARIYHSYFLVFKQIK